MKHLAIILLTSFIGCQSADKETLIFLNEGMERCNEYLQDITSDNYSTLIAASKENPMTVMPIKQKTDSIHLFTKDLNKIGRLMRDAITKKFNTTESLECLLYPTSNSNLRIEEGIDRLCNLINRFNSKDSFYVGEKLDPNDFLAEEKDEISILEYNQLANKVLTIEYYALSSYAEKVSKGYLQFMKILPVVIPYKRFLRFGEEFKAKIFLTEMDTIAEMKLRFANDTLSSVKGIFHYQETPIKIGKHIRGSVIEVKQIRTGNILAIPIRFEFQVIR